MFVYVVERDFMAYRRMWVVFLSGFAEPFLFLLSIGLGVGHLVGSINVGGTSVSYQSFAAPALLATSAMNGAVFDTTFNFFFKFKYSKSFDAMLATPIGTGDVASGELVWALLRGTIYSAAFLVTMVAFGLVESWWSVLALPAAVLIGFGFAGAGMAATTWMRSFVDFDYVTMALIPMFLFSATFFPLSRYPAGLQFLVSITPLYQGVAIERALTLGQLDWTLLLHAAYLAVMGIVGLRIAGKRLTRLLQP
ncbi:MAG TPA: ABC transporter permease [Acidimicrobiia bacterium]|jgi:lipooligosaccharide transport system permease protein